METIELTEALLDFYAIWLDEPLIVLVDPDTGTRTEFTSLKTFKEFVAKQKENEQFKN